MTSFVNKYGHLFQDETDVRDLSSRFLNQRLSLELEDEYVQRASIVFLISEASSNANSLRSLQLQESFRSISFALTWTVTASLAKLLGSLQVCKA